MTIAASRFLDRLTISSLLVAWVIPAGWFALLTGLLWVDDRPDYHRLFYIFVAFPTVIAVALQPSKLTQAFRNPLILAAVFFCSYTMASLAWLDSADNLFGLAKRPLYVLVLLVSASLLASHLSPRVQMTLFYAASAATLLSLILLVYYWRSRGWVLLSGRFSGYGALINPLLSAHVFGFFAAYWLSRWFTAKSIFAPLSIVCFGALGLVLLETGSRTPLMALGITFLWLVVARLDTRSITSLMVVMACAMLLWLIYPEAITQRGLSYRPEIWQLSLEKVRAAPWFGHGYGHEFIIQVGQLPITLSDPHNIELAVLLAGGIVGLALWIGMYAVALYYGWRHRSDPAVLIASSLVVFGLAAGLTEGRDFISRPKEHWFLIWIPLANLAAVWISKTTGKSQNTTQVIRAEAAQTLEETSR